MVLIARLPRFRIALAIFAALLLVALLSFGHIIYGDYSPYAGLVRRDFRSWSPTFTAEALRSQFINPQGITSILLLIGGDIIGKAIAQLSCSIKHAQFTPVLFSYGWVSYVFGLITNAAGGAGYFPSTDYSGLVMNLKSGDKRTINSWVIGRLFRDLEKEIDPDGKIADHKAHNDSLRVEVYMFDPSNLSNNGQLQPQRDAVWWSFVVALFLQIGVASIPMTPTNNRQEPNFYVLLITLVGTMLSIITASLQANRSEKYGRRQKLDCRDIFALTKGNGYNIVIILLPNAFESNPKPDGIPPMMPYIADMATASYRPTTISRIRVFVLGLLWIILLLLIGGATADSWYLLLVGGIGMVHTIYVAGAKRDSAGHGIPLKRIKEPGRVRGGKGQMIVLVKLEKRIPGAGYMLRREFFNGPNTADDKSKWRRFLDIRRRSNGELTAMAKEQMNKKHFSAATKLAQAVQTHVADNLENRDWDFIQAAAVGQMATMSRGRKIAFVEHLLQGLSPEERMMRIIKARRHTWEKTEFVYMGSDDDSAEAEDDSESDNQSEGSEENVEQ